MNGEVFVVWGGNWELAKAVEKYLKLNGYIVQIGGIDNEPLNSKFFLGDEIVGQLKRASRALILAQSPDKKKAKDKVIFRPNLAWEWGYLSARLIPAYVHVFLIGIIRSKLFSDLGGVWSTEISMKDVESMATEIVDCFLSQVRQASWKPLDNFRNWSQSKQWIENQVNCINAPDNLMLASAFIHAIQPAFYSGEIELLTALAKKVDVSAGVSSELAEAIRVCVGACSYYNLTDKRIPTIGQIKQIEYALVEPVDSTLKQDDLVCWINIVRLNFLGLVQRQMSQIAKTTIQRNAYISKSSLSFNSALECTESLSEYSKNILPLWRGYILRNIGRVQAELVNPSAAEDALRNALSERKRSYGMMKSSDVGHIFLSQLLLEILAVEIDLIQYGYEPDIMTLDEAIESLKEHRRRTGVFGIWERAIKQATSACKRFDRKDLLKELQTL